jgi:hypothetical protein
MSVTAQLFTSLTLGAAITRARCQVGGRSRPGAEAQATLDQVHQLVVASGRRPDSFGVEGRVTLAKLAPEQWADEIAAWRKMWGVTHVCVDTMRMGLSKPDQHIDTLRRFKEAVGTLSRRTSPLSVRRPSVPARPRAGPPHGRAPTPFGYH